MRTAARALARPLAVAGTAAALATAAVPAAAAPAPGTPNDPLYAQQWGPQQVRAQQAWATSTGSGVVIAVVDSGVDLTHPDLKGRLVKGATFTGCGPAPCGNGDWRGPDGVGQPDDAHGTHVAGIAAAATGNRTGIAGVAPNAKIMPVKVLEEGGGSFEDIAAGIRWSADHGAKVVNLSLGALQGVQALTLTGVIGDVQDAITYANGKGVTVVAAAGNDAVPLCNTPGFDAGSICVAATDRRELPAAYGSGPVKPDLRAVSAPGGSALPACGEDVLSTVPAGLGGSTACGTPTGYEELAGTSMASPHVAGVAALLVAQGRSRADVEDVLLGTARTPGSLARGVFTPEYGYGIVDAAAAVAAPRG
ncbi:subtilase family protein [Kineococcus xinjiangensis]|uniref:Subtilase family protein n=1 Tax=Kineococcus xinjiangensis TaxID=512762 RepID=A0A2S6IPQ3_9ACTN|nr:S8 family peptidase [Kineococcus xinjiangensis]PPK96151.1 subtilase family protein [Kineococcus xinjiangensis]